MLPSNVRALLTLWLLLYFTTFINMFFWVYVPGLMIGYVFFPCNILFVFFHANIHQVSLELVIFFITFQIQFGMWSTTQTWLIIFSFSPGMCLVRCLSDVRIILDYRCLSLCCLLDMFLSLFFWFITLR